MIEYETIYYCYKKSQNIAVLHWTMSLQTPINCAIILTWMAGTIQRKLFNEAVFESEGFWWHQQLLLIINSYFQRMLANLTNGNIYSLTKLACINLSTYATNDSMKVCSKLIFCAISIRKFVLLHWALKLLPMGNLFSS